MPAWPEAVSRLRELLASRGHPTRIRWVFREDFFSPGFTRHRVRQPLPERNEDLARACYESARSRGRGAALRAQFELDGACAASIWVPEAEEARLPGLAVSAARPLVRAAPVRGALRWWLQRLRPAYRHQQRAGVDVPRRADVVS